jgi:hypothetical protein
VPRDFIGVKHERVAQGGADGLGGVPSVECPPATLVLVDLFRAVDHPAIWDEPAVIGILGVPLNLESCFYIVLKRSKGAGAYQGEGHCPAAEA